MSGANVSEIGEKSHEASATLDAEVAEENKEAKTRRQQRYRLLFASSVVYVAIIAVVLVTLLAYPDLAFDGQSREIFLRENYQVIVVMVALVAGLSTAAAVTPRALVSTLGLFLPGQVLTAAMSELFESSDPARRQKVQAAKKDPVEKLLTLSYADPERAISKILQGREPFSADSIIKHFLLRMQVEQTRLKNNALVNLVWGVLFSVLGLAVLSYPLFFPPTSTTEWTQFIISYMPRGSLALLLAVISFFFLRLYASNEFDLKHNKNEISTFESKVLAARLVSEFDDQAPLSIIAAALAHNERNFILKRGERTTSGEIDRTFNDIRELLKDVAKAIPSVKAEHT